MVKADDQGQKGKVSGRAKRRIDDEKSRKRRLYTIVGAVAGAALIALLGVFLFTRDDNGAGLPPVLAASSGITAPVEGRVAGEPGAPVTVVEWGDYQ